MGTIKTITHLEESKKLAEFLTGADYTWFKDEKFGYVASQCPYDLLEDDDKEDNYPCWTLPALLDVIPDFILAKGYGQYRFFTIGIWSDYCDTPIDAAVNLIIKLHEEGLL